MATTSCDPGHSCTILHHRHLIHARITSLAYVHLQMKLTHSLTLGTVISRERADEALKIVQRLHRDETDPDDVFAFREYQQMKQQYEIDKNNEVSWKEMFMRPSYRKRVIIGAIVMFGSQTTGTTVIASMLAAMSNDNSTLITSRLWTRALQRPRLWYDSAIAVLRLLREPGALWQLLQRFHHRLYWPSQCPQNRLVR